MRSGACVPDMHDEDCCADVCLMVAAAVLPPAAGAGLGDPAHGVLSPTSRCQVVLRSTDPVADKPPPRLR